MYIRRTTRSYKGTTYTNHLLVESVHTAKGPRQKTICSLGDLSPRPRQEWLALAHKIEDALVGQPNLLEPDTAEVADIVRRVRMRQGRTLRSRPATPIGRHGDSHQCRAGARQHRAPPRSLPGPCRLSVLAASGPGRRPARLRPARDGAPAG